MSLRCVWSVPRVAALVLIATSALVLTACAGGASASPPAPKSPASAPEDQRYIATAIALKASNTSASGSTMTASAGPRTAMDISTSAPSSGLLDSKHLAAGKGCDSCHGTLPAEGKPATPTTAKCLTCHGGSYEAVAAKTASLGTRNPHKAHTGRQDCTRCHYAHRPFEFSCNACHTFQTPARFAVAVQAGQTEHAASPGGAVDKTED